MSDPWISPGEAAQEAFAIGMKVAALVALAGVAFLYVTGVIASVSAIVTLGAMVPVYFVLVAALLSKWLGLDPDITDLRPVDPEE